MLAIAPAIWCRRITSTARWIRKNCDLTLSVNSRSQTSSVVLSSVPRSVAGGAVHQDVEPAEALLGAVDEVAAVGHALEIGMDVLGRAARAADLARDQLAALDVAAADRDPGGAARRQQARDRLAEALGPAGDRRDLAGELLLRASERLRVCGLGHACLPSCARVLRRAQGMLRQRARSWQARPRGRRPACGRYGSG